MHRTYVNKFGRVYQGKEGNSLRRGPGCAAFGPIPFSALEVTTAATGSGTGSGMVDSGSVFSDDWADSSVEKLVEATTSSFDPPRILRKALPAPA